MKVLVLGADGYLGWPTCLYFSARGHEVHALDSGQKRRLLFDMGRDTLVPVPSFQDRIAAWTGLGGNRIQGWERSLSGDPEAIAGVLRIVNPDAIIHYAEQPSAPFSMMDISSVRLTQENNILGTLNLMFAVRDECPDAHILKLGTMGEYGTPGIRIEEGWIDVTHRGKTARMLYPKSPGSFYHLSKVHDSHNLEFGCRAWGLRVTDLNQGVVYGFGTHETGRDPSLGTMLYYDDIFGTVLNRFVTQTAAGEPMSIYGKGGQTRGYLHISDTMRCVEIAALHPAKPGEFRVFNQFTETFLVRALAGMVEEAAKRMDLPSCIEHVQNPRTELESHYYEPANSGLRTLGHRPQKMTVEMVQEMLSLAIEHKDRIRVDTLTPSVDWKTGATTGERMKWQL